MKEYSEALVRKLDNKVAELAEAKERLAAANQELERGKAELAAVNQDLERRIRQRTAMLEAANRELEIFSYSVSHDLRSPLRGIEGLTLAVLEDFPNLDAGARELLQGVCASTRCMNALIDGLLRLSRVTQVELRHENVDLTSLARETIAGLLAGDPSRSVEIAIAENLHARGDPVLLRAVLQNLLGNAWKFTAKRTPARIEFGVMDKRDSGEAAPAQNADASTLLHSNTPVFFVRDNGAGFDMTYAGKLFGPFQRLHAQNEFAGHGIGLATVQRIIHRHGGRIWAKSKPEEGATFLFCLENDCEPKCPYL